MHVLWWEWGGRKKSIGSVEVGERDVKFQVTEQPQLWGGGHRDSANQSSIIFLRERKINKDGKEIENNKLDKDGYGECWVGTGLLASLKWRLFFTIPRIFIHSLYDSSRTASPVVLTLLLRCSTLSTRHFCPVFQQPALFLAFFSLPGPGYWSHPRCCPHPNSQGSCFESCSCFWVSPAVWVTDAEKVSPG